MKSLIIFAISFFLLHVPISCQAEVDQTEMGLREYLEQDAEPIDETLNFARGHQQFKDLYFKQHEKEFIRLVEEGQSPQTLFIGCSDSRIVPDLILGTRPGDLFVIRTAGNFVPAYLEIDSDGVSATIEYAVHVLKIRHIIVCGHSHCGAIKGMFQELDPAKFRVLKKWLRWGEPAKKMALTALRNRVGKEELYEVTEQLSVIFQLENLMTYPFVKRAVDSNELEIHGWYYTIETGELEYYDPVQYAFRPLFKTYSKLIKIDHCISFD